MTLETELAADTKRVVCQLCLLLDTVASASDRGTWVRALAKPSAIIGHEAVSRRLQKDFHVPISASIVKNHRRHPA